MTSLSLSEPLHTRLMAHLLDGSERERAGFGFARVRRNAGELHLEVVALDLPADGIEADGTAFHLEVAEEVIGRVIKRAHDLGAALVEFHSHPFEGAATFSPSDRAGLAELVPHVRWRLRKAPYVAIVVATDAIDALVWDEGSAATPLSAVVVAPNARISPTGNTLRLLATLSEVQS